MNISKNNKIARRLTSIALIVAALVFLLGWLWPMAFVAKSPPVAAASQSAGSANISPSQLPRPQRGVGELQEPGGPYVSSDPRWAIVRKRDKVDHNWEWKMPIDFYGRVVDENDRPIPGARIEFSWTDLSSDGSSAAATVSGSDGTFSLRGKTGRVLQVDVSKGGFYKPRTERLKSFDYAGFWEASYYQPDPAQPAIFHLRKKGEAAALNVGETQQALPSEGMPVRLSLLNGCRPSPEGQMEVAAVTNTEKYPPRTFDWQASITIPTGGLLEHDQEFPFEAPTDGYSPKIEFKMPADARNWRRSVEKNYFIRFGNPTQYGRIHVRFNGASQKVSLRYAVNPTGSRNLEAPTDEQFSTP